jgi:hypothetical protein
VLDAIDLDPKFIYVLSGWGGYAHDASILAGNLPRRFPIGNQLQSERDLIEEHTVGCQRIVQSHYSLRVTIEGAFAALKN